MTEWKIMSHLEQRLENDLNNIRQQVADMGASVKLALENAFIALQEADEKLAFATILSDLPINRQMRKIDKLCHEFIAVHLPSAGHLRYLSSVIRSNIILERIGDYAVTVARESVQINSLENSSFSVELRKISSDVMLLLNESIAAFNEVNTKRANSSIQLARQVEHDMDEIYADLMETSNKNNYRDVIVCFVIFNQLKRVADQAKNLSEETIFVETGETKKPKTYRIQFIDHDNSCLAPMAQLIAQKIYPEHGSFSSAGVVAADALSPEMVNFMKDLDFNLTALYPKSMDESREALSQYHLLIGLNQHIQDVVNKIPFRTSVINWYGNKVPVDDDKDNWEGLYKELAYQIRELMSLLHGDEI